MDEGFRQMGEGFRQMGEKLDEGFRQMGEGFRLIARLIVAEGEEKEKVIKELKRQKK